jgi:NAD(P)-dependent dehydrogenase (short-subunit alcohol dehydrogenase family)
MTTKHKTIIVTGASQGIGAAVTNPFLVRGYNVVTTILDLLTLDEPPGHLLPGSDALTLVKPVLRTALDQIDIWEKVSRATDSKHS